MHSLSKLQKIQHLFLSQSHYLHYFYSVTTTYNIILWYHYAIEISCGLTLHVSVVSTNSL